MQIKSPKEGKKDRCPFCGAPLYHKIKTPMPKKIHSLTATI